MKVLCWYTPSELRQAPPARCALVIIDTFRMTSVAISALSNGCGGIRCLVKTDEALALRQSNAEILLGGEREGKQISGFDFGNSPLEYTPERVKGRCVALTTTNGTLAVHAAMDAKRLLLGAFLNAQAVAEALREAGTVGLLCAGTQGALTLEDVLTAGAVLERLQRLGVELDMDDASQLALQGYRSAAGNLDAALRTTRHYRNLAALGPAYQADLAYCMREDILRTVPEYRAGWFVAK